MDLGGIFVGSPTACVTEFFVRDFSNFKWYMIPFLLIIIYMISKEIRKQNWSALLAALAFWLMDLFNEIWNALIYHFTNFAPFWSTPPTILSPGNYVPNSSLIILIGLNIEICFMFLIMGLVSTKMFKGTIQEEFRIEDPVEQREYRRKRIKNRLIVIFSMASLCVIVEIFLNLIGILVWEWEFLWSIKNPVLIYLIGYLPFWGISAVIYDMRKRWMQILTVSSMFVVIITCMVVFILLGWI